MAGASDFLEGEILDHVLNGNSWTLPTANEVWIGLFTAAPSDAGGGTEVSGGSYARESMSGGSAWTISGTTPTLATNAAPVTFTQASASWGTIGWVGIFDAVTVGNLLFWDALSGTKDVDSGDTLEFAAGDLDVTCD